jgi:hypothetical protein
MSGVSADSAAAGNLGAASTTSERIATLVAILDTSVVCRAADVSSTTVRNWIDGTEPRPDAAITIDDLRSLALLLLEGGFEPPRIRSWLLSRDFAWLQGERPLEQVSKRPATVLSAAQDAVNVFRFGPEGSAFPSPGDEPASRNGSHPHRT